MKYGITVCTWSGGKESLEMVLSSLKGVRYPVFIWVNDGMSPDTHWLESPSWREEFLEGLEHSECLSDTDTFEIGAIYGTLKYTDWDEFVFLQDTIQIKDIEIFDRFFIDYPGQSVAYNPQFQMYLGKYRREPLEKIKPPIVTSKEAAIKQEELFTNQYRFVEPTVIFNPNFIDNNTWEYRFGRKNMILEDKFIKKYKGTWGEVL